MSWKYPGYYDIQVRVYSTNWLTLINVCLLYNKEKVTRLCCFLFSCLGLLLLQLDDLYISNPHIVYFE